MRDRVAIAAALAEVRAWQRAFEWELAKEIHAKSGAVAMVRRHTHDLYDHIQIVELASLELGRRAPGEGELVGDIATAAGSLKAIVQQLVAGAQAAAGARAPTPPPGSVKLIAVEGPCRAAIARVTPALAGELAFEFAASEARVGCDPRELEHLVAGLALEAQSASAMALLVRARTIDGAPWIEVLRTTPTRIENTDLHELRILEALVTRVGGELARSEARGGGDEFVVALPCSAG